MLTRRNALMMLVAALLVAFVAPEVVQAQAAANATGSWKWTQAGRGGGRRGGGAPGAPGGAPPASQPAAGAAAPAPGGAAPPPGGARRGGGGAPIEVTLDLKQEGEKLTGSVIGMTAADPAAKIDITDGTIKGSDITFKISRTGRQGGAPIVTTYKGKIDGDAIKGTMETDIQGNPISAEWSATRAKKA